MTGPEFESLKGKDSRALLVDISERSGEGAPSWRQMAGGRLGPTRLPARERAEERRPRSRRSAPFKKVDAPRRQTVHGGDFLSYESIASGLGLDEVSELRTSPA